MQLKPAVATSNPGGSGIYSRSAVSGSSGGDGSSGSAVGSAGPSTSGMGGGMRTTGRRY
jgi:hypothetical protein